MSDQVSDQTSTGRTAHTLVAGPIRAGDWITAVLTLAPAGCGRLTAAHYDPAREGVVEAEYALGNGPLGKRASLLPLLDGHAPAIHGERDPVDEVGFRAGQIDSRLRNLRWVGWSSRGKGPGQLI